MAITETFRQVDSCFNRLQLSGLIEDVQKARAGAAMVLFLREIIELVEKPIAKFGIVLPRITPAT
ncbi:hypothetical protein D910_01655 [Dendroctonus ponderosae]|uniref:Uncharacterized protein n=1 Tax=Dendroctonus ponderosae TaxID=77166 RepID=U4TS18_DENPD|nr:hypothetical protein D910_00279 [Dendroctonus ponderosae]ERL84274.1 hypothetical protein D910_01655 [Dendroctonus ponderosae]